MRTQIPLPLFTVLACLVSLHTAAAQGAGVRHLGPMAQDFYAAFRLGESERTITTVDADGVALAAIQGLNQKRRNNASRTRS